MTTEKRLEAIKTHKLSGPMVDTLQLFEVPAPGDWVVGEFVSAHTARALVQRGLVVRADGPHTGRSGLALTPVGREVCDALFGVDRPELPDGYDEL